VELWKQTHHMQFIYFLVALKSPRESEAEEIKVVWRRKKQPAPMSVMGKGVWHSALRDLRGHINS